MPWTVRKSGGTYKVMSNTTNKAVGTHSSPSEAQAQIRSLNASYYNGKKKRKRKLPGVGNSYSDAIRRRLANSNTRSSTGKYTPVTKTTDQED
jgi:hypothetical protein